MDLEEWEVLSDDGYLEIHDDDGGNKIFSRNYAVAGGADPISNYFICPSPKKSSSANQHHVLLQFEGKDQFADEEDDANKQLVLVKEVASAAEEVKFPSNSGGGGGADHMETADQEEAVSQVSFKKGTHEFVDMKLDSPRSAAGGGGWGVLPQIEPSMVQFDKGTAATGGGSEEEKRRMVMDSSSSDGDDGINNNIWKWSLHGIGAICSFGVAAATICIIIFGSNNHHHKNNKQNQKIRFQIYADEKRIKQVVVEQASSKLNEAILAVRGVPLRRAHFTCGGYYEAAH